MIHKKKVATKPAAATATSKPARATKPAPAPVEDEETYEDEPETEEVDETEEEDEDTTPAPKQKAAAKSGGKAKSLASKFDSVAASNNADNVPVGKYEAIVRSAVLQEPDAKGQSVRINFELCNPDFGDENQITTWFRLFNDREEPSEGGIRAFKQTMARLGYEVAFADLDETLAEITEEQPGVILDVRYTDDKKSGARWQRATVDSECNNDVVQEYKDKMAY